MHHRHMAAASLQVYLLSYLTICLPFLLTFCFDLFMQLQKAAKLLDSGAVRATRFLWRYPTARVILLFYLVRTVHLLVKRSEHNTAKNINYVIIIMRNHVQVFVHLFLMYLLHRLQVCLTGYFYNCSYLGFLDVK